MNEEADTHAPAPRLFLVTPPVSEGRGFAPRLLPLLETGLVSVVLLKVEDGPQRLREIVEALRAPIQESGAALLIDAPGDPRIAMRLGVDGVHVEAEGEPLNAAIEAMKPHGIVGVGGLASRHDAMEAGEKDIDYVMFGDPRPDGSLPPLAAVLDRAAWWAEIFNPPCVAYAADLAAVAPLARTGADFVAIGPFLFDSADCLALLKRIGETVTDRSPA